MVEVVGVEVVAVDVDAVEDALEVAFIPPSKARASIAFT